MSTMPTMPAISRDLLLGSLWRMKPHSFAQRILGNRWIPTRLNQFLGDTVAEAVYKGGARIIVNVAPRQGKSELFSFGTPLWFLENFPTLKVIMASYGAELATKYGRRVRNEFSRNPNLITKLLEDSKAADRWDTQQGGGMMSVGVGGGVTGFGGDLILVDDPHKGIIEAMSFIDRQRVINWFEGTLMRRLEPKASIVLLMQRWHKDDLTGHLLKTHKDYWKLISLPALAEAHDSMGRHKGEAVCPERYTRKELLRMRKYEMTEEIWDSQYQQRPPIGGLGRTYDKFTLEKNVAPANMMFYRKEEPIFASFDFNTNPGMHAVIGQANTQADYVLIRDEIFAPRMKTPECAMAVVKKLKQDGSFPYPKLLIYGDRSGRTENSQTSMTDYSIILQIMRENNIPTQLCVPHNNPMVKDRIAAMNDSFIDRAEEIHLFVHKRCELLIRDFEQVTNGEDGLPDKSDTLLTHASDAAGYAVSKIRPLRRFVMMGGGVYSPTNSRNN